MQILNLPSFLWVSLQPWKIRITHATKHVINSYSLPMWLYCHLKCKTTLCRRIDIEPSAREMYVFVSSTHYSCMQLIVGGVSDVHGMNTMVFATEVTITSYLSNPSHRLSVRILYMHTAFL